MKRMLLAAALTVGVWLPSIAQAHFIWLVQKSEDGKQNVHVYFSEDAEADSPELLKKLDRLVAKQISATGDATELKLTTGMESLTTAIDPGKGAIVAAKIDYGVVARNESNRYFIVYNAKSGPALDNAAWTEDRHLEAPRRRPHPRTHVVRQGRSHRALEGQAGREVGSHRRDSRRRRREGRKR